MERDPLDRNQIERSLSKALAYAPVAVVTFWLARVTTHAIVARAGEPAVPLDDAYIHFQYARALAEGRFFAYVPGAGYTSGATSLLWPAMLAPFYAIGFRDTSIIWIAWLFGWSFLALLAIETKRLAAGLVGERTSIGAGAAVLAFGAHTWFAASGMEVTLLAWCMAYTARLASTWGEQPALRTLYAQRKLLALSVMGPLIRPEGMVVSLSVFGTLLLFPQPEPSLGAKRYRWGRVAGVLALGGLAIQPLINRALTGHWAGSTTLVKWLPLNPYYGGTNLGSSIRTNIQLLIHSILDGREWSAIFIPPGALWVMIASFCAIPLAGIRTGRWWRATLVICLAIGIAIASTYFTFLWNRLRYLWPFAFAWCIGLACLARAMADFAGLLRVRYSISAPLILGVGVGLLAHHLSWSIDDVATSAYAIHSQQVLLGRWAHDNLPQNALVGVNDTGAIAYFSDRKIFDIVGLTTPEEARYWVAGPGSRFEHYERIFAKRPKALPSHFIVYPNWFSCEPLLGRELTRATVLDQSILGGATMIAYEARYDRLHSGDLPEQPPVGKLVDDIDISDLESEEEHNYNALSGGMDTDNLVFTYQSESGREQVDAGRQKRSVDTFRSLIPQRKDCILVARWSAPTGASLALQVRGSPLGVIEIPPTSWIEQAIIIPANSNVSPAEIEVQSHDQRTFASLHYWVYSD